MKASAYNAGAARAERRMLFARSDGRGARPAARAARQGARLDVNGKPVEVLAADALSGAVDDLQLGHDAKRRKIFALQLRERALGGLGHIENPIWQT